MSRMSFRLCFSTNSVVCAMVALSILFFDIGCHPLSGRFRGPSSPIEASTEDDWAPPKTSRYAQPQQYIRRTKPGEPDNSTSSRPPSDKKSASNTSIIKDTDKKEIDFEGAIESLPPNLQEMARRQFEVLRNSKLTAITEEKPDSASLNSSAGKLSKEVSPSSESAILAQVKLGEPQSIEPPKAGKVTAKLTDQESVDTVSASSVEPASNSQTLSKVSPPVSQAHAEKTDSKEPIELASAISIQPAISSSNWNVSVNDAIQKLERTLIETPSPDENLRLNHELTLRLLNLANRQLDPAMRPIEGLSTREQDYFRHQLQALYEASNPDAMPPKRRWSLVMNSQRQATHHLAAASNLEVRSLAFCTDVQGYGVLTKFSNYQFKPDQEILLYCELENVLAEQVKAGFETELQGTYEIIDPNGRRIADQLLPMEKEICQNHRRDYFIIYHIFMPMQIAPGKYQMRVTIEDMKASKFGQSQLDFQIQK